MIIQRCISHLLCVEGLTDELGSRFLPAFNVVRGHRLDDNAVVLLDQKILQRLTWSILKISHAEADGETCTVDAWAIQ